MVKVAIVILNWNGLKHLTQFMPSVVEHSSIADCEVWVADNGSTDSSVAYLQSNFPVVRIMRLDKNYGFTGGYNRALKEIQAEYYVLLNSDVEVTSGWIEPVISAMDSDVKIAAAMPKLLAYHDKKQFEYAGAAGGFIDKYGYPFCRGRMISTIEEDQEQYNDNVDVFWATGACLFVKSVVYHTAGGLDEDFFAHMEEIDLCWRLKSRGFRILYVSSSEVYHVGGGTLPNNNPRKLFLNYRNNLLLLYKNLPSNVLVRIIFVRMVLDGMSSVLYLLQRKWSFFLAVPKAHFAFYKMLSSFKNKRINNINKTKVDHHKEVYQQSLVISFFVKGLKKFSQLSFK